MSLTFGERRKIPLTGTGPGLGHGTWRRARQLISKALYRLTPNYHKLSLNTVLSYKTRYFGFRALFITSNLILSPLRLNLICCYGYGFYSEF